MGLAVASSDEAGILPCTLNSQIKSFHLPADGNYLIVVTSFNQTGSGNYQLQLTARARRVARDPEGAVTDAWIAPFGAATRDGGRPGGAVEQAAAFAGAWEDRLSAAVPAGADRRA